MGKNILQTNDELFKIYQEIHGNKYDYSLLNYQFPKQKIKIICKEHGVFEKTTYAHKSEGCPKCRNTDFSLKNEEILKHINIIKENNQENINFQFFEYKGFKKKSLFVCNIHGEFFRSVYRINKTKYICPKCNKRKCNSHGWRKSRWIELCKNKRPIFYILEVSNHEESFYKIGITTQSIKRRYHHNQLLKTFYKYKLVYSIYLKGEFVWDIERKILKLFKNEKYLPLQEFEGNTECFKFKDVYNIIKLINNEYN